MEPFGADGFVAADDAKYNPVRDAALCTLLLAGVVGSVWITGFTPDKMRTWGNAWDFLLDMFPPDWSVLPTVLRAMAGTVGIAFLGTFLAFLMAFPASFVTARTTGSPWAGRFLPVLMSFMRSVPEILWAILFVVATELGNVPGSWRWRPSLLLGDEPVASLDPVTARSVMTLLAELSAERGLTTVLSLHDVALAREFCPRAVAVSRGRVIYDGPTSGLSKEVLDHIYSGMPAGVR